MPLFRVVIGTGGRPLLVAEGLDGVEVGGFACRVPAEEESDGGADGERDDDGHGVEDEGYLFEECADDGQGQGVDAFAQEDADDATDEAMPAETPIGVLQCGTV